MFAILIDAVRCFQNIGMGSASRRRNFADAEFWLFRATDGPFSFETVCDTLEIDANRLRQGLLRWQTRKLAGERVPRMIRRTAVMPGKRLTGGGRLHRAKATGAKRQVAGLSETRQPRDTAAPDCLATFVPTQR
jgi:hypothetical protein